MSVSATQRAQYAYNAGFRNGVQENGRAVEALSIMVAISLCECGVGQPCETSCVDVLGDSTCGIIQADCVYQPACRSAVDPQTAMDLAWGISSHGTDFSRWATYTETSAPNYFMTCLPAARAAVTAITVTPPPVPTPILPTPPPHYTPPPPRSSPSDAGLILVLAGIGLVGFALERTRPGSITGILRSAPSAGGIRSGSLTPILRP